MSCIQTLKGITLGCDASIGGLKTVYIANYSDVVSTTVKNDEIVAITMKDDAKFKQYSFKKNTASMTSTLTVGETSGNIVTTDVVLSFIKQETSKRVEMTALSLGELVMIVADANGKFWYLGQDMPVVASAGTGESGTSFSDANRYEITLQDTSFTYPYEIKVAGATTDDKEFVDIESLVG